MSLTPRDDGMSVARLMDEASTASGLTDWGDHSFSATLELLIGSCRATAHLTAAGWGLLRKVAVRHLRNQLYLQAFLTANPGTVDQPVASPVFITGLPRTGTTMLHNLLSLDADNRVLRFWEGLHPVPVGSGPGAEEALVRQAGKWLDRLYTLSPGLRAIHHSTARGPEECDALLQNAFASQHFDDMFQAESYSAWLNGSDLVEEYGYYKLQLQALARSGQKGRQWMLKSPGHLGYLDTVLDTFPDALVVHCHRQPAEAIASYASLVRAVRAPHCERVSPLDIGRHALGRCSTALGRAMRARERRSRDQFVDLSYTALVSDPVGAVVDLYGRLGRSLGPGATAVMQRWLAENPQAHHGRHQYALAEFGVSSSEVSSTLAGYCERFHAELGGRSGFPGRVAPGRTAGMGSNEENDDVHKADYSGATFTDAFDAEDRQGVMGPSKKPKHRAPAGDGVRAPFAKEGVGPPQMSVFDGKGNESVVVVGQNEKGEPAKGSGPTTADALDDAKIGEAQIGDALGGGRD